MFGRLRHDVVVFHFRGRQIQLVGSLNVSHFFEQVHQLRQVKELAESRSCPVAGSLRCQLQCCDGLPKSGSPAVEVGHVQLLQAFILKITLHGVKLGHGVADRCAGGKDHATVSSDLIHIAAQTEELVALARHKKVFLFEAVTTQYLENYAKIRELLPRVGTVRLVQCNFSQYSSRYDAFCAGETPPVFDPACAGGALMDLGVYNVSYIVGLFGEPNQVHYTANVERGIDTSGILTMDYTGFKAVSMAAKDCAAPARCIIQGTKGYIQQKSTANCCGGITFHPNEGKEEHYNLNGGRPREAAEFETFARAMESGDQELCTRMQDTSIAVSRVLTVARRSAGIRFPGEK